MPIKTEVREITPVEAIRILEDNPNNRNIRQKHAQTMARDMKAGRWRTNGESIKFNGGGGLQDGQHRLMACIIADRPFTTVVISGLTEADHPTIDTGAARTFSDELRFRGETNVADLAAVTNLIWQYDIGSVSVGAKPSRSELLNHLKKNPTLRDSVKARKIGNDLAIRGTAMQATYFLISREHGERIADIFLAHLQKGTDYAEGDPCLALRNYAINMTSRVALRPNTPEWFAVCIKAANAFLTGSRVRALRWRTVGPKRENFPALVSKDDAIDILDDYADDLS